MTPIFFVLLVLLSQTLAIHRRGTSDNLLKWAAIGSTPQQYYPAEFRFKPSLVCPMAGNSTSSCDVGFTNIRCSQTQCPANTGVVRVAISVSPNCDETLGKNPNQSVAFNYVLTTYPKNKPKPVVSCGFTGSWPNLALACNGTKWNDQTQGFAVMEWCGLDKKVQF
eukprot:TRINITY_DN492_c0_g1_i6.p1 TRINITY_DN492_c0_g1~~TRINITY_DN492_c0_g1_i6.p1  ORF type:complete len:166 (-),score=6.61 TRINITY_DN492_c0_g1_i6:85-582(-)